MLMVLYLILSSRLDYPILFLSEYINNNKTIYYTLLNEASKTGDLKGITLFMLSAIEIQSKVTADKIVAIHSLIREVSLKVSDIKVVNFLFSHPYLTIKQATETLLVTRQTASKYLSELERSGILQSVDYGKSKLFYVEEFLHLLS